MRADRRNKHLDNSHALYRASSSNAEHIICGCDPMAQRNRDNLAQFSRRNDASLAHPPMWSGIPCAVAQMAHIRILAVTYMRAGISSTEIESRREESP